MKQSDAAQYNVKAPKRLLWSINTKLAVGFSAAAVAVLLIVEVVQLRCLPFTSFEGRQAQEKDEAFRGLTLIADLKKQRLSRCIQRLRDNAHAFAENDMVRANVADLRAAARDRSGGQSQGPRALRLLRRR